MTEYDGSKSINAETADAMFRRFAKLMNNPAAVRPQWDEETGRYSNESISNWLDLYADGLVYGVRIPVYDYSPVTTAIKTGANAGLVLEPSTESEAGRNDYEGRKLFMCPRVNGGVDNDGMPYVTAIEGMDDAFDARANNTFALRPVYWKKVTEGAQYVDKEFTDGPREGFSPVRGAYTSDGDLRPYILRACYMDSDGTFDSKSGTVPGANYIGEVSSGKVAHCASNDFTWSKNRTADGLTYLDYGDVTEQIDMMQLMLGVKAPREKAVGCVSYNFQYTVVQAESGVKRVVLSDAQAANILVGSRVSVGDNTQTDRNYASVHNIAKSALVLSKASIGDGKTAVNLDLDEAITTTATSRVTTMPWANGSCDDVLGMYGAPTAAGLTNGMMPFRFLNVEWQLGLYEVLCNLISIATVADGVSSHAWKVAPNVDDCSGIGGSASGWTTLSNVTEGATGAWRYIKDYACEDGASMPSEVAGTSTTGFKSAWYPSASSGDRETLVGGYLHYGSHAGVGCVNSVNALTGTGWHIGGRASAIGHSAPAE
ncbi:MAG: hypothetical protein U0M51_04120 [Eggerthellaceae bacterium]